MAQEKKSLITRLLEGKEKSEEYARSTLPTNRWQLFWDIFKGNFGKIVKVNLLILLFFVPTIAMVLFRIILENGNALSICLLNLPGVKTQRAVFQFAQAIIEIAVNSPGIDDGSSLFVQFLPMGKVVAVEADFTVAEHFFNHLGISADRDTLIPVVEIIVIECESQWQPFDDMGR